MKAKAVYTANISEYRNIRLRSLLKFLQQEYSVMVNHLLILFNASAIIWWLSISQGRSHGWQ